MGFSRQEYWSGVPSPSQSQFSICLLSSISTLTRQKHTRDSAPYLGSLLFQRAPPHQHWHPGLRNLAPRLRALSHSHVSCQQIPSAHLQDTRASLTSQKFTLCRFYKRPTLVSVFTNQNKSEEDLHFSKKGGEARVTASSLSVIPSNESFHEKTLFSEGKRDGYSKHANFSGITTANSLESPQFFLLPLQLGITQLTFTEHLVRERHCSIAISSSPVS